MKCSSKHHNGYKHGCNINPSSVTCSLMEETEIKPNIINRDTDKTQGECRAQMLSFILEVGVEEGVVVKTTFELATPKG